MIILEILLVIVAGTWLNLTGVQLIIDSITDTMDKVIGVLFIVSGCMLWWKLGDILWSY